ncbi:NHLP leader peptide family natural product precursor [Cohnella sp. CFH 77786]|uniref:NHLP leader peptide family RiPP precursor n=1 Tax=Cohnella sp. CFH 77786 TaxID=2662265 RepID=UPI001C60FADD|nr:NHLP leader peptide family RiPP precursor [Cohnella sp. CFH 77786]MBW5446129.1 NHLP leader peptide family natural product precursor [Cohnella sp. CFH 77786]
MSLQTLKAQIIQKAWKDPEFKAQLLADPGSALQASFGITLPEGIGLQAVEETSYQYFLVIPSDPADQENLEGATPAPQYNWG